MERVFYHNVAGVWCPPTLPSVEGIRDKLRRFKDQFRRYTFPAAKLPWEAFPSRYVGRKKIVYQQALDSLLLKPLRESDAKIRSFIKVEKLPYGKKPVVPRVISPRSPRYNLVLGCFLSHLEHSIYDIVGRVFGGCVITKGLDAFSVGKLVYDKWQTFSSPVAYGLDASRFDQHVSPAVLAWEHSLYQMFYRGRDKEELSRLLKQQLRNRCECTVDDGRLFYTTEGTRCSGDMNTALGNCLIMCAAVYSYMADAHPGVHYELVNNGDDCVLMVERGVDVASIAPYFSELGFVLKVEPPVFVCEHIDFCQARPVFDGRSWRMVRDPRVSLSKDSITVKPIDNPKVYPRYLRALGDCGMSLCYGLPVLQEYYECQRRQAGGARPLEDPSLETGFHQMAKHLPAGRYTEVSAAARVSFGVAFSIPEEAQRSLEQRYRILDLGYRHGPPALPPIIW